MSNKQYKVAVVGGGSWGTAIVSLVAKNINVLWWVRRENQINQIKKKGRNTRYLPNCKLNTSNIQLTHEKKLIFSADLIIVATPSEFLADIFSLESKQLDNKIIVSAVKGVIPQINQTPQQYFKQLNSTITYGVISGPCHAEEVALLKKSYLTFSSPSKNVVNYLSEIFNSDYINIKLSNDVIGTELAAILKNVYALATGICSGLGYGDNFLAVLITASTNELKRVLFALDPKERVISQSAYLGDLLVTCYSLHSRNRRFGNYIGKGYSVESTKSVMNMVAEGYNATACVYQLLSEQNMLDNIPIISSTYNILYNEHEPEKEMEILSNIIS
jgi:glycerol-3-phosphate dehydrogenase (NAD(P)+)